MAAFLFLALGQYKENVSVAFIFGGGALLCSLGFIEQIRFAYFKVLKKPVLELDENFLTEKLADNVIAWKDMNDITFYSQKRPRYSDEYILITSKVSEQTIKIRGRLVYGESKKEMQYPEIINLINYYKEKYGNESFA